MNEHVKVLTEFRDRGGDVADWRAFDAAIDAAIAALGHGEAVAWVKYGYDDPEIEWGPKRDWMNGDGSDGWHPLYTHAPQPVVRGVGSVDRSISAEKLALLSLRRDVASAKQGHPEGAGAFRLGVDRAIDETLTIIDRYIAAPTHEAQPQGKNPGSSTPTSEGLASEAGQGVDK